MNDAIDVVVVGAGPVGLLTAIELTLGGARVLVLERLAAASTASKALGVGPLGSEALQRRGMGAALAAAEARSLAAMQQFRSGAGAGPRSRSSAAISPACSSARTRERAGAALPARGSAGLEAMLAERARALGIEVRRECEVTGFVQHADGVDVEWTSPTGDGQSAAPTSSAATAGAAPSARWPASRSPARRRR